jgi:2-methylcitrate dehydratase PrpD
MAHSHGSSSGRPLADTLGAFVARTTLADIPRETVAYTKSLALKTLAGMMVGASTGAARPVIEWARESGGPAEAGILGAGFRSSIEVAVLANAHSAHAAELEDDQFPSATSDITVFPVVFPMVERWGISGESAVVASAVAIEVMNRIGRFSLAYRGITDLPYFGVIGAAVAAAKALGLDEEQVKNAIGIAVGRAGGYIANFGTDAHYFESSMASRDGYFAALMARRGLTGTTDLEKWLRQAHGRDDLPVGELVEGLGTSRWDVHNVWVKKYPCCFLTHRQIDMMLALRKQHGLVPDAVAAVEVDVGPVDATCDRPNPKHVEDSRFSFQHILASALTDGDVGYPSFDPARIADPKMAQLRQRIRVNLKSDWKPEFNSGIAKLAVTTRDGRVLVEERDQPLGGSRYPLDREQFLALYEKYTKGFLAPAQVRASAELVLGLERHRDLATLMRTITFGASA